MRVGELMSTKNAGLVIPIPLQGISQPQERQNWQKTLATSVTCSGLGVHSGQPLTLTLRPASVNAGYVFIRTDVAAHARRVPARWDTVSDTSLCTTISNQHGVSVSTIEHVIAALAGCGIHNALLELDGPEVPIMDGSAAVFSELIHQAGTRLSRQAVRTLKVLKPIEVKGGSSRACLTPCDEPKLTIHFDAKGRLAEQSIIYYPNHDDFLDLLAAARTFGFYEDAQVLWDKGLAQGASLENTIVIKDGTVMNEEGLRFADEFVRHKMLDAVGDLALSGMRILGHFQGTNSGHMINNQVLRALFADDSAWCILD
jgi:UDP-3-O-[3-hydroxymyristoyl] N-acetylglucosamine deacetylase